MESGILLTVNLPGRVIGCVKHTTKQTVTVDVTPLGVRYPEMMTRKIKHSDREMSVCTRKLHISSEVVLGWQTGECPHWVKPTHWKTMNKKQRLESHVNRFDEGFGVSYA